MNVMMLNALSDKHDALQYDYYILNRDVHQLTTKVTELQLEIDIISAKLQKLSSQVEDLLPEENGQ